jgi:hypothetical protein
LDRRTVLSLRLRQYDDVSQAASERCLPIPWVGPASVPAKTTGTEAGPTYD